MNMAQVIGWLRIVLAGRTEALAEFLELARRYFAARDAVGRMEVLRDLTQFIWRQAIEWARDTPDDEIALTTLGELSPQRVDALAFELLETSEGGAEAAAIDLDQLRQLASLLGPLLAWILNLRRQ